MKAFLKRIGLLCVLVSMFCSGCALPFSSRPSLDPDEPAHRLLLSLKKHNARLEAFKGIGRISLQQAGTTRSTGLAWLCQMPDQLRFELLAPSGQPLASLACDGQRVYFLPRRPGAKLQIHRKGFVSLEKLTGIPIEFDDLVPLLAGRIPLAPHDTVHLDQTPGGRRSLSLEHRWFGRTQIVHFNQTGPTPARIDFLAGLKDRPAYTVIIDNWQSVQGYDIPRNLTLTTPRGLTMQLRIRRFWPVEKMAAEKFQLTRPPEPQNDS